MTNISKFTYNAILSGVFLVTKDQFIDSRIADDSKLHGYILSQKYSFFSDSFDHQGKFPRYWKSWEDAVSDIKKNGIKEPIEVKGTITAQGKKYIITHGCHRVVAGIMMGLTQFPAREIIGRSL